MYLIAEIGINHDGDAAKCADLVRAAAGSGVNAVKFQYRNLERAYYGEPTEIGDEILIDEIRKTYLSPKVLLDVAAVGRSEGVDVGVSFFDHLDADDFGADIEIFDFFKIPSAELANAVLVQSLEAYGKPLYLSTGCQPETSIESAFSSLDGDLWTPLHCISNYPTSLINAGLGQITHLRRRWNRPVGYSSHDADWEVCLLALQLGATVIERHLTFDPKAAGLDHSTSSTPDHFAKLRAFAEAMPLLLAGDGPRAPNQGELMNLQNLGRSFYAARELSADAPLQAKDLAYRAPNVGLGRIDIGKYLGRRPLQPIAMGAALCRSDFDAPVPLSDAQLDRARDLGLALPVRLHDVTAVSDAFPIGSYEFHLSYKEVLSGPDANCADGNARYSVHLPDYINSTQLMDPFAPDEEQRRASRSILEGTAQFAMDLSERTGVQTPIVGSFSVVPSAKDGGLARFHSDHNELLKSYQVRGVQIAPQWLPPVAWYFGGSVSLTAMNSEADAEFLVHHQQPFCLDVCHMLLGRNVFGFDVDAMIKRLSPLVTHVHLADALGVDGEGLQFGEGDEGNMDIVRRALALPGLKVIEVWQGHLDRGAAFREALRKLTEL